MIHRLHLLLAASLLAISLTAVAQIDNHITNDPAKALYGQSTWAHGYIHGYEMGFHDGDIDLHMGRSPRDPKSFKEFKQAKQTYKPAFGNRNEFSHGYETGFEMGYLDGSTGKDFRAAGEAEVLANKVDAIPVPEAKNGNMFDIMLEGGYASGRKLGLADGRSAATFDTAKGTCPTSPKSQPFCPAYELGFRWGYTDGYSNQRQVTTTEAKK